MHHIAIFASGEGTNAENIIRYFAEKETARVVVVVYNKETAGVKLRAERLGVDSLYIPKQQFQDAEQVLPALEKYDVDYIVLAGFLLVVPPYLIQRFPERIVNIHPSLMPKYCGKGMYGMKVHEAVVAAKEKETGITIHLIDEDIDRGKIVAQERCKVEPEDTPEDVAQKVHRLEYAYFPVVIEQLLEGKK